MRIPPLLLLVLPLLGAATACEPGSTSGGMVMPEGNALPPFDPALGWLGTFEGSGAGLAGEEEVRWDHVRLVIRFDAADDAGDCSNCLTLTLADSLFRAVNVRPGSDVELRVAREGPVARRTLTLLRYSGGGGTGNVVQADLLVRRENDSTLEASFLLTR